MDCRTARPFLMREQTLSPDEQQAYRAHLTACVACRDDHNDLLSRALVQTTRELALPPPDFTATLMQRLPSRSPLQIAAEAAQGRRKRLRLIGGAATGIGLAAVALGLATQSVWTGTTLGLMAHTILTVAAAALGPLVVMLASAIAIALLLQLVTQQPTASRALGSALVASLLLLSAAATATFSDTINSSVASGERSTIATILRPVQVTTAVNGDIVSLGGDITVDAPVRGDVATISGRVSLAPAAFVAGDVLAGAGELQGNERRVAGRIRRGTGAWVAAAAGQDPSGVRLAPALVRALTLLLGALVTLVLAGLVVIIWPQRTLRTSRLLPAHPWTALGLGISVTVLLVLLALPLLAFLAATVVGLLLVPLLLVAIHLPYVQGLAAVGQALGHRLTGAATTASALWGVAAQLVLVIGLGLVIPSAGLAAFYLLASLGVGAQVLTRRLA